MRGEQGLEGSATHRQSRCCGERLWCNVVGSHYGVQGDKLEVVELTGEGSAGLILPNTPPVNTYLFFFFFCMIKIQIRNLSICSIYGD